MPVKLCLETAQALKGCNEGPRCRKKGSGPVVATWRHKPRARDRSSEETTKYATRTTDEVPAKKKGAAPCTVSACLP